MPARLRRRRFTLPHSAWRTCQPDTLVRAQPMWPIAGLWRTMAARPVAVGLVGKVVGALPSWTPSGEASAGADESDSWRPVRAAVTSAMQAPVGRVRAAVSPPASRHTTAVAKPRYRPRLGTEHRRRRPMAAKTLRSRWTRSRTAILQQAIVPDSRCFGDDSLRLLRCVAQAGSATLSMPIARRGRESPDFSRCASAGRSLLDCDARHLDGIRGSGVCSQRADR